VVDAHERAVDADLLGGDRELHCLLQGIAGCRHHRSRHVLVMTKGQKPIFFMSG
jgi:hypothetical protein